MKDLHLNSKKILEEERKDLKEINHILTPYGKKMAKAFTYFINLADRLDINKISQPDLIEKHFPKGRCKERGKAIVLHAEMLISILNYIKGESKKNV